jgi:hypothetical protein
MRPKACLETTVVSYLTALPSRDLVLAAHQQVTRDWTIGAGFDPPVICTPLELVKDETP